MIERWKYRADHDLLSKRPDPDVLEAIPRYCREAFAQDNGRKLTALARRLLKGVDYDTIVTSGLSGDLVGPLLAARLGKHHLVVRKAQASSHDGRLCIGRLGRRWIFVDDLIDSGETFNRCALQVERFCEANDFTSTCVGAFTYHGWDAGWRPAAPEPEPYVKSEPEPEYEPYDCGDPDCSACRVF